MTKIRQYKRWFIFKLNRTEIEEYGFYYATYREFDAKHQCPTETFVKAMSVEEIIEWVDEHGHKRNPPKPERFFSKSINERVDKMFAEQPDPLAEIRALQEKAQKLRDEADSIHCPKVDLRTVRPKKPYFPWLTVLTLGLIRDDQGLVK